MLQFDFNFGDLEFHLDIPSSLQIRLPVELQGSTRLVFNLNASASGNFSFSITLDGIPHVRIQATTSVDVASSTGRSSLSITTTRTECHAQNAAESRRSLESAGNELRDSILTLQNPPDTEGDQTLATLERLGDVVSKIASVYSAVERAEAPCQEVPMVTFGATGAYPLGEDSDEPGSLNFGLTLHF